jgi:cytochrome c peroxidase
MSEADNSSASTQHYGTPTPPPNLTDERGERRAFYLFLLFLLLLFAIATWLFFGDHDPAATTPAEVALESNETAIIHEPIQPLPLQVELDPHKVALGQLLFFDPRLSRDNSVACAACHDLSRGGTDGKVVATGIGGAQGTVNTLSVFNSAYQLAWFWDGRATTLYDQIDGPIHNPKEMGAKWEELVLKLRQVKEYQQAFQQIYPEGITEHSIKDAIVAFEQSLITPNARFDRYLRGDHNAIDADEKLGYQLFKEYGCIACHQGMNIGGNMFQIFGVAKNYFESRGNITQADLGRFNVTGLEEDRHRFRVPSLRNVALTAPYFHDGSRATLEAAVRVMAEYQLGRTITDADVALIVRFLHTLTGEYYYQGGR